MSKGLEALKEIEKFIEKNLSKTKDNESFNLGFDVGTIEMELKALEIIKRKLSPLAKATFYPMTQEEYDLLKEVLL